MDENRYEMTGVITEIGETKQYSPFFKKCECKLRISDIDFTNKIVERKIKFGFINDNCELIEMCKIDDSVTIKFYIDGRDIEKDGKVFNFTSNIGYDIVIINSPSRTTDEDRKSVVTAEGLVYKEEAREEKEVSLDDLINAGREEESGTVNNNGLEDIFNDLPF